MKMKTVKQFNPFQNPFRLIAEIYNHSVWIKQYRLDHVELQKPHDDFEQNTNGILGMLMFWGYLIIALIWILGIVFAPEVVDVVLQGSEKI